MTPTGRTAPPGEEGIALIEVLVSALILAIVAAGVMALLQATTRSAADERRHSEAYAIAQEDQARLRSLRLSSLNRLEQTRNISVGGNEFTVKSQGVFVNNTKGQPSSCTSGETSADYVRITSTTTWPGSRQPVVIQSIVSPSNGSLDPNHGTLVVTTKNAASEPLAGVGLSATGAGTFSGATDSTGCANFTDLPAGNYSVTPNGPGLVNVHGESAAAQPTSVIAGGTNTLQLQFDYGATLPVKFKYLVGSGPAFQPAKIDSVFVFNALMNPAKAYWTPTKARQEEIMATPIFPFTSPDTVYAGACEVNNPGSGAAQGSVTLSSGKTYAPTLELQVPALELTVMNGSFSPAQRPDHDHRRKLSSQRQQSDARIHQRLERTPEQRGIRTSLGQIQDLCVRQLLGQRSPQARIGSHGAQPDIHDIADSEPSELGLGNREQQEMPLTRLEPIHDESGTTLVELMVAIMTGLVILSALTMVILTTLHGSVRVTARVHATQRARLALDKLMEELHSACVTPEIAPVKEKSNGTVLRFVHQTGSEVAPTPVLSVISLSGGTLTQSDYKPTGGTAPNWTFSEEKPSSTQTLLTKVAPIPPSSSIFSYYSYSGGTISSTPQTTPLSKEEALLTVEVHAALTAAPETTPVADAGASASVQNSATLRLTPPSFNEGSPARPCA